MGRNMYIGVKDTAKRVKKIYIGVGDKAKKVLKGYVGVGGKAKLFFSSECEIHTWDYPKDESGTVAVDHGTCEVCGFSCPETSLTTFYSNDNNDAHYHLKTDKCTRCDFSPGGFTEEHTWNNSICTDCGYKCTEHDWTKKDGKCAICGYECTDHDWTNNDGKCAICGYECQHEWNDGVCTQCGYVCQHEWDDGVCITCTKPCDHQDTEKTYDTSTAYCEGCGTEIQFTITTCECGHIIDGSSPKYCGGDSCSNPPSEPSEPDPETCEHNYVEISRTEPSSCLEWGEYTEECTICHNTQTIGIQPSASSHNFSQGFCQNEIGPNKICGVSCGNEFDPETGLCIRCGDHVG